jgi:branched-chain amino acid transport system ATP-binding protein
VPESKQLLAIESLTVRYGGITALREVHMEVPSGGLVALVGRNGAGKSTLVRAVSGVTKLASGSIKFEGVRIDGKATHKIARMGLVHVPEDRQVLGPMSVRDNLELGRIAAGDRARGLDEQLDEVFELFPILKERKRQLAGSLSGGEQQMLVLGRALMANPILMLLDEPSLGLAPIIVKQVFEAIQRLNDKGIGILLIEQNVKVALQVAHTTYVLDRGQIVRHGSSDSLREDPAILADYLGLAGAAKVISEPPAHELPTNGVLGTLPGRSTGTLADG